MEVLTKIFGAVILVILLLFLVAILISIPVMLLWNWLVPIVFPTGVVVAHHITFWQAFGVALLCSFLFKSTSSSSSK